MGCSLLFDAETECNGNEKFNLKRCNKRRQIFDERFAKTLIPIDNNFTFYLVSGMRRCVNMCAHE